MLKRLRKSSARVSLVLIGLAGLGALSGCGKEEMRRDVYASKEDCLADWGNSPKDCEPAYDRPTGSGARTHYYGPSYLHGGSSSRSGSASRAIGSSGVSRGSSGVSRGSSSVSRGGFGSSGHSASG